MAGLGALQVASLRVELVAGLIGMRMLDQPAPARPDRAAGQRVGPAGWLWLCSCLGSSHLCPWAGAVCAGPGVPGAAQRGWGKAR